jgi:hypothetical protein
MASMAFEAGSLLAKQPLQATRSQSRQYRRATNRNITFVALLFALAARFDPLVTKLLGEKWIAVPASSLAAGIGPWKQGKNWNKLVSHTSNRRTVETAVNAGTNIPVHDIRETFIGMKFGALLVACVQSR